MWLNSFSCRRSAPSLLWRGEQLVELDGLCIGGFGPD